MNLWLSCHLLFAGLVLGSSAPTPEECKPLVTTLSLDDLSVKHGKVNFLAGYTDHDFNREALKLTDSSWMNITASSPGSREVSMSHHNKMNGTCFISNMNMTFEGNSAKVELTGSTSSFLFLPSCDGCQVVMINSTIKNVRFLMHLMKINLDIEDVITTRSLHLLGKETTLKEADLENFKQQASCLGFSGDPDFIYNTEKSFCAEDEGIKIPV